MDVDCWSTFRWFQLCLLLSAHVWATICPSSVLYRLCCKFCIVHFRLWPSSIDLFSAFEACPHWVYCHFRRCFVLSIEAIGSTSALMLITKVSVLLFAHYVLKQFAWFLMKTLISLGKPMLTLYVIQQTMRKQPTKGNARLLDAGRFLHSPTQSSVRIVPKTIAWPTALGLITNVLDPENPTVGSHSWASSNTAGEKIQVQIGPPSQPNHHRQGADLPIQLEEAWESWVVSSTRHRSWDKAAEEEVEVKVSPGEWKCALSVMHVFHLLQP